MAMPCLLSRSVLSEMDSVDYQIVTNVAWIVETRAARQCIRRPPKNLPNGAKLLIVRSPEKLGDKVAHNVERQIAGGVKYDLKRSGKRFEQAGQCVLPNQGCPKPIATTGVWF